MPSVPRCPRHGGQAEDEQPALLTLLLALLLGPALLLALALLMSSPARLMLVQMLVLLMLLLMLKLLRLEQAAALGHAGRHGPRML